MTDGDLRILDDAPTQQVTLWSSIRSYWWIVLASTVVFGAVGLFLASRQDVVYEATAGVIIEDPRAQDRFAVTGAGAITNQASERYLADQVEILRSVVVASVAVESLDWDITPGELIASTTVEGELISNLIEVTSRQSSPERAKAAADAVVAAYIEVQQDSAQQVAANAVSSLVTLIENVTSRLTRVEEDIQSALSGGEDRQELIVQLEAAQAELNAARLERDAAPLGSELRVALNARIDELLRDFQAWETLLRIEQPDAALTVLYAERDALVAERAALIARQDELVVGAAADDGGVVLVSPAELPEDAAGLPGIVTVFIVTLLGVALGVAIAYGRSLRQTKVSSRTDPAALLSVPMIADVPRSARGATASVVPVVSDPDSEAAEAYRFVASAVSAQQKRVRAAGEEPARVLAVAGSTDTGRAQLTANLAIAYAQEGHRVLAVDADFKDQGLTGILSPRRRPLIGIADLASDNARVDEAVVAVTDVDDRDLFIPGQGGVYLLARGSDSPSAHYVLSQSDVGVKLEAISHDYDLMILDAPSVNRAAYAEYVIDLADGVLASIVEGEKLSEVEDLASRLDTVRVPLVGYVYQH